jgi:hypothetical protein
MKKIVNKMKIEAYCYQFLLKDAYINFSRIPIPIQNRIFLAFNINPDDQLSKLYWE